MHRLFSSSQNFQINNPVIQGGYVPLVCQTTGSQYPVPQSRKTNGVDQWYKYNFPSVGKTGTCTDKDHLNNNQDNVMYFQIV